MELLCVYRNQIYEMWYEGYDGSTYCIGYATSSDGITWDRYAENPVLSPEFPWEGSHAGLGSVLFHDSVYKMWYYGQPDSVYIGYATAPDSIPTGLYDEFSVEYPGKFFLLQNYPNPFNPITTIEFELPKTSDVKLKIYTILGEEVATLVSGRLTAGSYTYDWDASNLPSGVYLYRLSVGSHSTKSGHFVAGEAGEFVETRKMVLMR